MSIFFNLIAGTYNAVSSGVVGDGTTYDSDAINDAINNTTESIIIIGQSFNDVFLLDKPIIITRPNVRVIYYGTLKMDDALVRNLTANVAIGDSIIPVANADQYFKVGQQVVVNDDTNSVQGGSGNQTRRAGSSAYIQAVSTTSITLESTIIYNAATVSNARVGHFQSVFVVKANNVIIEGLGLSEIDVNKNAIHDIIYPVSTVQDNFGATDFGCGISYSRMGVGYSGGQLRNCIIKNAPLHNISTWSHTNFSFVNIKSYDAHDKNFLFYGASNGFMNDIYIKGAIHEDGIIFYNTTKDVQLGTVYIEDCARSGFTLNAGCGEIQIANLSIKNCGQNVISGYNLQIGNLNIEEDSIALESDDALLYFQRSGVPLLGNIIINSLSLLGSFQNGISVNGDTENIVINSLSARNITKTVLITSGGGESNIKILSGAINSAATLYDLQSTSGRAIISNFDVLDTPIEGTTSVGYTLIKRDNTGITNT